MNPFSTAQKQAEQALEVVLFLGGITTLIGIALIVWFIILIIKWDKREEAKLHALERIARSISQNKTPINKKDEISIN